MALYPIEAYDEDRGIDLRAQRETVPDTKERRRVDEYAVESSLELLQNRANRPVPNQLVVDRRRSAGEDVHNALDQRLSITDSPIGALAGWKGNRLKRLFQRRIPQNDIRQPRGRRNSEQAM